MAAPTNNVAAIRTYAAVRSNFMIDPVSFCAADCSSLDQPTQRIITTFCSLMRVFFALFLLCLSSTLLAQSTAVPPPIAAKAYVLSDFNSSKPLVAHNPDQRIEPASLTKLMTAYLTFAALRQKTLKT
ncbi:MAG TPA: hypothetical protein VFI62_09710, partial [Burkholderiales bacterium]|nr:hypothetical protein [Burkholderiales bacterium]